MKIRKLISLISSLAIVTGVFASFATVSYATETTPANINVEVSVDEWGYYCVDYMFSLDDTTLGVAVSKTNRGVNYYSGTGILGVAINVEGLSAAIEGNPVMQASQHIISAGAAENDYKDTDPNRYSYSNAIMAVQELAGSGEAAKLVSLATNFSKTEKTADEIKEMFSNLGYVSVKTVTVTDISEGTNVSSNAVTYAISAPGEKHVDADYSININPATEEPVVDNTVAFEGFTGTKENGEADGSVSVAAKKSFTTSEDGTSEILWTVTLNDEDNTKRYHTSTVDFAGGADYTLGMVINGLAESLVKTIEAVLQ